MIGFMAFVPDAEVIGIVKINTLGQNIEPNIDVLPEKRERPKSAT